MHYYGVSDIGKKRKENQDAIYIPKEDSNLKLFILADGMGGANAGSVASNTAVEFVKEYISSRFFDLVLERENIENLINEAICKANDYVYEKSKKNKDYSRNGNNSYSFYFI